MTTAPNGELRRQDFHLSVPWLVSLHSLRRVLGPCAWGARKTPTFLGRTFRRLEGRIGKKKAALAIAHTIRVIVYHLLTLGTSYEEARYAQYNPRQEARERQRALQALERLGSTVTLERAA